jgi:hypothetical protein
MGPDRSAKNLPQINPNQPQINPFSTPLASSYSRLARYLRATRPRKDPEGGRNKGSSEVDLKNHWSVIRFVMIFQATISLRRFAIRASGSRTSLRENQGTHSSSAHARDRLGNG